MAVFDIPLQLWALQIFTGLALGSVLVLLAVGLSLIFGMLAVVNFAHGAFYMVGAYAGVFVFGLTGNFWLGLVAVPLIVGTIGLAVERVLIRPLYGRGIDYPLLLTFGLSYVFIDAIKMMFGKIGLPLSAPAVLQGAVNIGVGYFPLYRLFLIGAMAVIVIGLWLFLEKTSYGLVIRAGARDSRDCPCAWHRRFARLDGGVWNRHRSGGDRRLPVCSVAKRNSRDGNPSIGSGFRCDRCWRDGLAGRCGSRRSTGRRGD